jgi:copper chaperone
MSETTEFRVIDFDCPSCASTVERALSNQEGIKDVEVHYSTGRVEIDYETSVADPATFEQTIENQGYTPQPA